MVEIVHPRGAEFLSAVKRCSIGLLTLAIGLAVGAPFLPAAEAAPAQVQADSGPQAPSNKSADSAPLEQLQTVEITGTLIRAPNSRSQSPITSVSSLEIQQRGTTNISDVLNEMPQVHTGQTDSTSSNSTGVANLNLRGLGPTRTLVLIDGLRLGPGDPQGAEGEAADVNFIPAALVSSVDVLTGGASATYGSDAIAGVVNFHLIDNLQGVQVVQTFNGAQHTQGGPWDNLLATAPSQTQLRIPGNELSGLVSDTTIMLGTGLDDGRGHVTMYFAYHHANEILDGQRNYLACETGLNGAANGLLCHGSSDSAFGNIDANDGGHYALNPDGSATFVPYSKKYGYDTAQTDCLQCADERKSLGAYGHFRLNDWADVYAKGMFMDDYTLTQVAAGGLAAGQGPTGLLSFPCNNPFLSDAQEPQLCQDANGNPLPRYQPNGQPNVATILMPSLRLPQAIRTDGQRHTDYLAVLGVRGAIGQSAWTYDASATYWNSQYTEDFEHDVSYAKIEDGLYGCNQGQGADVGCVPINIFQYQGLTPAMLNYIETPGTATGTTGQSTLDANVSGDFGAWGVKSPWAIDPVAATFGVNYQRQTLDYLPDYELQSNDLVGQGQPYPPVSGVESMNGEYAEVRVPLAQDRSFVRTMALDAAIRHASYTIGNHPGFQATTFKVGLDYAPNRDVLLRASFNRATRAPNLYELFFPEAVTSESGEQDPCSGPTPTASLAACQKTGVTAAQYGNILPCRSAGCNGNFGGNPALHPETASTWTVGAVFTPRFARNLEVSVDYWDVVVNDFITSLPGQQILDGCLVSGIDSLCPLVHRGIDGILFGSTGYINQANENIGYLRNRGIDLSLSYHEDLDHLGLHDMGSVDFKLDGSYLLEQTTDLVIARYDCAGLYGSTCSAGDVGGPNFTWRHNARLTWDTPWDHVSASLRWRHLSSVRLDSNDSQPALNGGSYDAYDAVIPAYNYMDLSLSWVASKYIKLVVGCNNLMDKDPPVLSHGVVYNFHGAANEDVYTAYDVLGRELFLTATAKF